VSATPKHALLRDDGHWEGIATTRLQQDREGALTLVRVPAGAAGATLGLAGPWTIAPSGLAVAQSRAVCIADTDGNQVLHVDPACGARTRITGLGFVRPRGLAIVGDCLHVADSGNARVQLFDLTTLELRAVWDGPFAEPVGLAADSTGRVYVLDVGRNTVLRLSAAGVVDDSYIAAMAAQAELVAPAFLAVDEHDTLYVSDYAINRVLRFDPRGQALGALEGLTAAMPRALATDRQRLYVADAASGEVRVFDFDASLDLGAAPGFCGPVAALYIDDSGVLHIKTDLGLSVVALSADDGCVETGDLVAGPLDAGMNQAWERALVSAIQPPGTHVELEVFLAAAASVLPSAQDWATAGALDTLLPPPLRDGSPGPPSARYLWLRVRLSSADGRTAPEVSQVQATTAARSYIDDLPAVYAREDQASDFLRRWLALFRAELGDTETLLDEMARRFDPAITPADDLAWLAGWLAFTLPDKSAPSWSIPWLRELILQAHDIYTRRGTKAGLREAIERHTGLRPEIIEAYRERRIWQLGITSRLGFDTGLPPARADGAVVPDTGEGLVVGEFIVDQSGPQQASDFGAPLFDERAHLFSVVLPAGRCLSEDARTRLRDVVDAEKPAHTDYHLCLIEPRMRIGFQARVGIDAIVAGPREPYALDVSRLGLDAFVAESHAGAGARVGYRASIGQTMRVG
jgi:phage tail-like protein